MEYFPRFSVSGKCLPSLNFSQELFEIDEIEGNSPKDMYDELMAESVMTKKIYPTNYQYESMLPESGQRISSSHSIEYFLQPAHSSLPIDKTMVKCTCSKSKCRKNYCECYKMGLTCGVHCSCTDCHNTKSNLSPSIKKKAAKKRCKCKKSHCSKKYCECHNAGRKCTKECDCAQCENYASGEELSNQRDTNDL